MPKYFCGSFNAGATNTFEALLENFCIENDFIISEHALSPRTHIHALAMCTTKLPG